MSADEREIRNAVLGLAGSMTAAADQARAMTDVELGECLGSGRWSTIEVHEAARRLLSSGTALAEAERVLRVISGWNTDLVSTADAIHPALSYLAAQRVPRG